MKNKVEKGKRIKIFDVINDRMYRPVLIFSIMLVGALMLSSFSMPSAYAAEGGWSSYTPGTYGEFSMNYTTPGLCFRENIIYYKGELNNLPGAPQIDASLKQTTWFNLLGISYITEQKILGANYLINANIPYGISSKLDINVPAFGFSQHEAVSQPGEMGIGDVWITPIGLMWNFGFFHVTFAENIVLPTGNYNKNNNINMGRNYASYETDLGFTWLDEKNGHEVSFIAGYMFNARNKATDYKTGDEFHIDYALNQFLGDQFAVGIVGYYYKQIEGDSSNSNPALDSYKSSSAGVGPAVLIGLSKDVQIIGKWIYEYHAKNRFEGNWAALSLAFRF